MKRTKLTWVNTTTTDTTPIDLQKQHFNEMRDILEKNMFDEMNNCLHDNCSSCKGTGIKKDGLGVCIHMISCPCVKCAPRF